LSAYDASGPQVTQLTLHAGDWQVTSGCLERSLSRIDRSVSWPSVLNTLPTLCEIAVEAHRLPERTRQLLAQVRLAPRLPGGFCKIAGHQLDSFAVGRTPSHWRHDDRTLGEQMADLLLVMYATLLGEPFTWAGQQDGTIVNDILPIRGHELMQVSSSSLSELSWHTEDAWHSCRADYVALLCLSNPDAVGTVISCIDAVDPAGIGSELWQALFEPRYVFRPDDSHASPGEEAVGAVLFGDPAAPCLRFDPWFMGAVDDDPISVEAMDRLRRAMERNAAEVVVDPGDVIVIDNYTAVHARRAFEPHFDGRDRWMKRINISRDFRRARCASVVGADRVIVQ
jgi:hypothetical protein